MEEKCKLTKNEREIVRCIQKLNKLWKENTILSIAVGPRGYFNVFSMDKDHNYLIDITKNAGRLRNNKEK